MEAYLKRILTAVKPLPVSLEVIGMNAEDMVREGMRLMQVFGASGTVVVKVPVNPTDGPGFEGIKAIRVLAKKGILVNCTLIFTPEQALLAAKAGAAMVSPFAGRIDDMLREGTSFSKTDYYPVDGRPLIQARSKAGAASACESQSQQAVMLEDNGVVSGIDLVAQCVEMMEGHHLKTEVLAASIRNARQLREAALAGSHIATVPFDVLMAATDHAKTREGMRKFTADIVPEYAALLRPTVRGGAADPKKGPVVSGARARRS